MEGSAAFLLDVLLLGVSCFLHLVGVELEKVGDDFGFGRVGRKAVGGKHGAVVRLMRGAEVGRHRERVVEYRKRAIGMCGARIENPLHSGRDLFFDRINRIYRIIRPWEGVVNHAARIAEVALQTPAHSLQPEFVYR